MKVTVYCLLPHKVGFEFKVPRLSANVTSYVALEFKLTAMFVKVGALMVVVEQSEAPKIVIVNEEVALLV